MRRVRSRRCAAGAPCGRGTASPCAGSGGRTPFFLPPVAHQRHRAGQWTEDSTGLPQTGDFLRG